MYSLAFKHFRYIIILINDITYKVNYKVNIYKLRDFTY